MQSLTKFCQSYSSGFFLCVIFLFLSQARAEVAEAAIGEAAELLHCLLNLSFPGDQNKSPDIDSQR